MAGDNGPRGRRSPVPGEEHQLREGQSERGDFKVKGLLWWGSFTKSSRLDLWEMRSS